MGRLSRSQGMHMCMFLVVVPIHIVLGFTSRAPSAFLAREMPREIAMQHIAMMMEDGKRVAVVGATGYIGQSVVKECVQRGYNTLAVTRKPGITFDGATCIVANVGDPKDDIFGGEKVDCVISCLASRSGTSADSWAIDYKATLNCLEAAKAAGARHFVLLSAFCVRKPLLQFQHAKLKLEEALVAAGEAGELKYSIVRPTAFFKSVSGQLDVVRDGFPFVVFDDGSMCRCNPISEADLATYIVSCLSDPGKANKILNIGGPDEGYSMAEQGRLLAEVCGIEPKIIGVPVALFDFLIGCFDFLGLFFPAVADKAERARIGRYYATENMLTTAPEEKFGTTTLRQHYEKIAREGQEFDPYASGLWTTALAKLGGRGSN